MKCKIEPSPSGQKESLKPGVGLGVLGRVLPSRGCRNHKSFWMLHGTVRSYYLPAQNCSSLPYHSEKMFMVPGEVQQRGAPSPSPLRDAHACLTRRSSPGSLSAHFLQVATSSEKSSLVAIHHVPSSLIISSLYFVSSGHLKTSAVGVFVDCLALPTKRRVL